MKVTLFRDMKSEDWRSMDRYADNLVREYRVFSKSFNTFSVEPPFKSSVINMIWRNNVYPFLATFLQNEINHILDHSYSHLLNFLDTKKTLITCHDLIPLEYEQNEESLRNFKKTVSQLKKAAFIIADSEATKIDLMDKLAISPEKIRVVYLGVETFFRRLEVDQQSRVLKKYNLPSGRIVLSHGNNLPYKNIEGILKAFQLVLQQDTSSFLVKSGPVALTKEQKDLVSTLNLSDHFIEITSPSDEDLVGLYNRADVFLCPSFKEGFGLPVLEALACGTPVVVSKNSSLTEIVGDCGWTIDPRNAREIAQVILEIFRGVRQIERSKLFERSKIFSWKKTAAKTIEVYEEVFRGAKR